MAQVIPVGFAHVGIQFSNSGDPDPWYVTMGLDVSDAGGDMEGVANTLATGWEGSLIGGMSTTTRLSGVQIRLGQDGGVPLTTFWPFNIAGGSSAAKLPQNCALLVQKVTQRPGRPGKGRIFIPNILSEGDVDTVGTITGSVRTELQGYFNDFLEFLADPNPLPPVQPVLLHNAGTPGGTTPSPITSWTVNGVIATQRRRLR